MQDVAVKALRAVQWGGARAADTGFLEAWGGGRPPVQKRES